MSSSCTADDCANSARRRRFSITRRAARPRSTWQATSSSDARRPALNHVKPEGEQLMSIMIRALGTLTVAALVALGLAASPALAQDKSIIVQSTTSTANSGLFDDILPMFTDKTGITVHVVAVGTGQAIKNAANGDGDVLMVHAKGAEEKFVADGF